MAYGIFALLGLALFAADQWVKAWTVAAFAAPAGNAVMTADPPRPLVKGVLELTRVHNYGAAWSSFAGKQWFLLAVTAAISAAIVYLLARRIVRHPLGVCACCLVLAGGIGNFLDRVRLGYVVDMLHLTFWPSYPTFNVADVGIVCGAVLGAAYYLFLYEKYDKKGRAHGKADDTGQA